MAKIDITKITDLELASFSMRAIEELQRAIQNVQIIKGEIARREKIEADNKEKLKEPKEK